MEIPVYVFTGFLGSGKSSVIKATMSETEFMEDSKTLLILCEEGEIEFDQTFLNNHNAVMVTIDKKEEYTSELLASYYHNFRPDQVMIEYNGTWDMEYLYDTQMPTGWFVAETISTIDASMFEMYLGNMKNMILEQIFDSDLVIFNRCNKETPKAKFRRNIKAINRKAQIIYEMEDGSIDNTIDEVLPFDATGKSIAISDVDYGIWYIDALDHQDKYIGKEISFSALIYQGSEVENNDFVPGRFAMTCCADDIQFIGFVCRNTKNFTVKHKEWAKVKVIFQYEYAPEYNGLGPVLYIEELESIEKPEEDLVYFT